MVYMFLHMPQAAYAAPAHTYIVYMGYRPYVPAHVPAHVPLHVPVPGPFTACAPARTMCPDHSHAKALACCGGAGPRACTASSRTEHAHRACAQRMHIEHAHKCALMKMQ